MKQLINRATAFICSLSVRKKFLLATTVSSLITLSLFGFAYVIHEKDTFFREKVDHLQSLSLIISSNSEAALSFDDPITAEDHLASLSSEPDITQAALFLAEGEIFASFSRDDSMELPAMPDFQGTRILEGTVAQCSKIIVQDEVLGILYIEVDTHSFDAMIRRTILNALVVVGLGTCISVLIAIFLQKLITGPLVELEQLAKWVAKNGDYSRRASKRFNDEIGSLVDSVNTMMGGIQERDEAIQLHNRDLEHEVSVRTAASRDAMEKAEAASRAKSDFLSTMSHELRTPLNAIVGMSSILGSEEIDPELKGHVNIIQSSSDSLLSLINQILDYSKIEGGHLELESEEFHLADCLEEAMDMVAALHWEKPIDFFITIDPLIPYSLNGDVTRLRQVIVNLLSNASKFTHRGYVWLEAKRAGSSESQATVSLAVHDTGVGIPHDRLGRLFKTFSQVDSSTTRKFGGTGLGLAISQKLVLAMGGLIEVSSQENQGSTFLFELPMHASSPETIAEALQPSPLIATKTISISIPFKPLSERLLELCKAWGLTSPKPGESPDLTIGSRLYGFEPTDAGTKRSLNLTLHHPLKQTPPIEGLRSTAPMRLVEIRNFVLKSLSSEEGIAGSVVKTADNSTKLPPDTTRILLAEDNKVNQKVFRLLMKREGYTIDIANDGREAVAAVLKVGYDIIFMDLQMPEMDGLEACRTIRADPTLVQPWIIGFTANVEADAAPAMRAAGMDDYISKPVKDERVRDALLAYSENRAKSSHGVPR